MKNKIIVWSSLMIAAAALWFVYVLGFHNGIKEGWAKAQMNGKYFIVKESPSRSLNYQAEPFPPPKPMRLPPLAQTQSTP